MNRLEFMHCLDTPNQDFASMVINSFDKFMALYQLVGFYDDLHISNENNVSFNVSFDDHEKINQLQNIITLNNYCIEMYGRLFQITINDIQQNYINLSLY